MTSTQKVLLAVGGLGIVGYLLLRRAPWERAIGLMADPNWRWGMSGLGDSHSREQSLERQLSRRRTPPDDRSVSYPCNHLVLRESNAASTARRLAAVDNHIGAAYADAASIAYQFAAEQCAVEKSFHVDGKTMAKQLGDRFAGLYEYYERTR